MIKKNVILALMAFVFVFTSCNNDDDDNNSTKKLTLNINGLEELGSDFVYEGWIIVDGSPISTGTFTSVNSGQSFTVDTEKLAAATKFVLSIEPAGETGTAAATPSDTKILTGDFSGNSATVSVASVGDFSNAAGKFILATPTNGAETDENSGIWFLDLAGGGATVGLVLPDLPTGWKYEGWVVIDGTPVTTGKFIKLAATDEFNGFSGAEPLGTPNGADGFFPGEDFLTAAPSGLTFPTDLAGKTAVISIEPEPDNSTAPFTLKPLSATIISEATDHITYEMSQNLSSFPTGTVER